MRPDDVVGLSSVDLPLVLVVPISRLLSPSLRRAPSSQASPGQAVEPATSSKATTANPNLPSSTFELPPASIHLTIIAACSSSPAAQLALLTTGLSSDRCSRSFDRDRDQQTRILRPAPIRVLLARPALACDQHIKTAHIC